MDVIDARAVLIAQNMGLPRHTEQPDPTADPSSRSSDDAGDDVSSTPASPDAMSVVSVSDDDEEPWNSNDDELWN
jgi:hypothetical protein